MSDRAAELRKAFDESFTRPPAVRAPTKRHLVVGASEASWAIPLEDALGVVAIEAIVPLPGAARFVLGLAGHRGATIAVLDLAQLLGRPPCTTPRWMVLANADTAFAFSTVQGWVETERAVETVDHDGTTCAVIDLPSILEDVRKRTNTNTNGT